MLYDRDADGDYLHIYSRELRRPLLLRDRAASGLRRLRRAQRAGAHGLAGAEREAEPRPTARRLEAMTTDPLHHLRRDHRLAAPQEATTRQCRSASPSRSSRRRQAFEAGATLVHLHVRNDDDTPTSAPERFAQVLDGIRKHCPGIITQVSTGGRSGAGRERGGMLSLQARHGLARHRLGQLPDPRLRQRAGSRRLAGRRDARARHQAGGRGLRPVDDLPGGRRCRRPARSTGRCTSSS